MNITSFEDLIGKSPEFQTVVNAAKMIAALDIPVLLSGETGSGKEAMARAIHCTSSMRAEPFVHINCAALSYHENLADHNGGEPHRGADVRLPDYSCTLFLDEVTDLADTEQARVLQLLEDNELRGAEHGRAKAKIRLIAGSSHDLYKAVECGKLRHDLYYRIQVVPIDLPALRERKDDIPLLLEHILTRMAVKHNLPQPVFTAKAKKYLTRYNWPGNVRELRNFCERMIVLNAGHTLDLMDLPDSMLNPDADGEYKNMFHLPNDGISLTKVEQVLIRTALKKTGGNQSKAARLLGLTRDTFLYRIKKHQIEM
jgi:DNA-binding NtrC family response regulator